MIPLSLRSSKKLGGATSIFSAVHFAFFPFQPHDGEMPAAKIGSLPGFFDRSIRPEPLSAPTRIRIDLQLIVSCRALSDSAGANNGVH